MELNDLIRRVSTDKGIRPEDFAPRFPNFGLNLLRDTCHADAVNAGWHKSPREDGTFLALIHSEISEALEGERKGLMDDKIPSRKMAEVELADAIIRIMDYCGLKGYDIGGAVVEKLAYNKTRADHKPENRAKEGGKKW